MDSTILPNPRAELSLLVSTVLTVSHHRDIIEYPETVADHTGCGGLGDDLIDYFVHDVAFTGQRYEGAMAYFVAMTTLNLLW
jgi:hypothetical protein